ncbi:MAG: DUF4474 domain-containing protein [Clostridiales bacterium]|nr:DUF4474 domain-containing protein [Clostridiales bacterium]
MLLTLLLLLCAFLSVWCFRRKKYTIRTICSMSNCRKRNLADELLTPLGFSYYSPQDIVTSELDAWQKEFGYCAQYDRSAVHFSMVFDCEPIYFPWQGQTWLIEFWKGQYGMNAGGEVGIYCADTLLTPNQYDRTLFHGISGSGLLPVSIELYHRGCRLFSIEQPHWWLTGFCPGTYCEPEDLIMQVSLSFPDCYMLQSFTDSLLKTGYRRCDLFICGLTVTLTFSAPHTPQPRSTFWFTVRFSQWKNRIFCRLFLRITQPLCCTLDRILYLYLFLPAPFRRLIYFRNRHRQRSRRKYRRS